MVMVQVDVDVHEDDQEDDRSAALSGNDDHDDDESEFGGVERRIQNKKRKSKSDRTRDNYKNRLVSIKNRLVEKFGIELRNDEGEYCFEKSTTDMLMKVIEIRSTWESDGIFRGVQHKKGDNKSVSGAKCDHATIINWFLQSKWDIPEDFDYEFKQYREGFKNIEAEEKVSGKRASHGSDRLKFSDYKAFAIVALGYAEAVWFHTFLVLAWNMWKYFKA